ncbi:MAG: hypothetical protein U9R75_08380 [Candidatus Thermoplasmatota archaeon]|nr:hypothetical protein [Candidatus Thermoplasmatota archaeon]
MHASGGPSMRSCSPLLIGIGGVGVEIASRVASGSGVEVLALDTDRRGLDGMVDGNRYLVGGQIVNGEGAGGNLNTAKACFKLSMDAIAPMILGRPLVVTVSSSNGSTGIAGSVEMVQFLSRVGLPTFSVLIDDRRVDHNGQGPGAMAEVLLIGPLAPASSVKVGKEGMDVEELSSFLRNICLGSFEGNEFPVPPSAWGSMKENGGSFELVQFDDVERGGNIRFGSPGIVVIRVPRRITVQRSRELIEGLLTEPEGMGLGILMSDTVDKVSVYAVVPRTQSPPPMPEQPRTHTAIQDLLGSDLEQDIGPTNDL